MGDTNYRVIRHKDGEEREDHKYVARIETKDPKRPYRYFYTMPAYKAYLSGQDKTNKFATKDNKLFGNLLKSLTANKPINSTVANENVRKAVDDLLFKGGKSTKEPVIGSKGKDIVEKLVTNVEKKVEQTGNKIEKKTEQINKEVEKKFKQIHKEVEQKIKNSETFNQTIVSKGKNTVEKYSEKSSETKFGDLEGVVGKVKTFVKNVVNGALGKEMFINTKDIIHDILNNKNSSEELKAYANSEQERLDQEERQRTEVLDEFSDLQKKDSESSDEEDQLETNPYFYTDTYAYTQNCAFCTAAYDLRQRGYDVEAAAIDPSQCNTVEEIMSWYDNPDLESFEEVILRNDDDGYVNHKEAAECLEADMLKHGEGARGHLLLSWSQGGGHDVIWEVENGEVVIRDCQTNEELEIYDYVQLSYRFEYFRTDNIEPNENVLKTVRNKGDD